MALRLGRAELVSGGGKWSREEIGGAISHLFYLLLIISNSSRELIMIQIIY
jgi:hypothetical protein